MKGLERIDLRGALRSLLRCLLLPSLRGSRQILIAGIVTTAIRQRVMFSITNLHFDLSEGAIHI